jgi:catechol-2,3-dioxygenase
MEGMRITRVLLETTSLDATATYYSDVLGLPVDRTDTIVSIRLGDALLEFTTGEPDAAGVHHLAFLVSTDAFDRSIVWLRARVPLLDLDGADEFDGPGAWDSRSVYFDGPDGSILRPERDPRHQRGGGGRDRPPGRGGPPGRRGGDPALRVDR